MSRSAGSSHHKNSALSAELSKHELKLSGHVYHCDVCRLTIDRDLNAAIDISRIGFIKVGLLRFELTPADRHFGPARVAYGEMPVVGT